MLSILEEDVNDGGRPAASHLKGGFVADLFAVFVCFAWCLIMQMYTSWPGL